MTDAPVCSYCNNSSVLVLGNEIYPNRTDLNHLKFWLCRSCDAYVGCHVAGKGYGDGTRPLGTLANALLRAQRKRAHAAFDKLWQTKKQRGKVYTWLAKELDIPLEQCHIAMFNADQCQRMCVLAYNF